MLDAIRDTYKALVDMGTRFTSGVFRDVFYTPAVEDAEETTKIPVVVVVTYDEATHEYAVDLRDGDNFVIDASMVGWFFLTADIENNYVVWDIDIPMKMAQP